MTKQKLVVTSIAVPVILALITLGFAAMSTNPPFTVPTWVPTLFFILTGVVTIALVCYLIWGLIRLIRFQSPITTTNVQIKAKAVPISTTVKTPTPPRRLEHDGVLWEDGGRDMYGDVNVVGPLCPKDYTPLSMEYKGNIQARLRFDTTISGSGYHARLVCLECHAEYTLGKSPKQVQESHDEVAVRFIGMRKRGE